MTKFQGIKPKRQQGSHQKTKLRLWIPLLGHKQKESDPFNIAVVPLVEMTVVPRLILKSLNNYSFFTLTRNPLMCLAIPMRINHIDGFNARCTAKGVERNVSLFLLQDASLQEGDHVLIHVGYAIQKITEEEALSTWELLDQMLTEEITGA